jgi:hypothetical protein
MIERQAEPPVDVGLDRVLFVAKCSHILPSLDGAELGGRSVLVGGANEQNLVTGLSPEASVDVSWKQRAGEIAEVFDTVHIGKRTGNENFGHGSGLSRKGDAEPVKSKSPSARPEGLGFGLCLGAKNARAIPSGLTTCGRAGAFD